MAAYLGIRPHKEVVFLPMSRNELLKHLKKNGCILVREGSSHSIFKNENTGAVSAVPRHTPVKLNTAFKICRELEIPKPTSR
jgi:mRNA interferase HicA